MNAPDDSSLESQALFDSAPCGLMLTTSDGTFLRVNRTFCTWVDYEAAELVGRRKFQELLSMGGRIFHQTHWAPLLAMQGSISEVKLELRQRDGTALPMVVNAILRKQDGVQTHMLAAYVARDRDKYERELIASRKRLEELVNETTRLHELTQDRAIFAEQMIGIVSHDLRNPIATIQMAASMLARTAPGQNLERMAERITRAGQRATRLISDLLDFTQARVGTGLTVTLQSVDLHALIADAVDELALAHPDGVLNHVRRGAGECLADPGRLEQLVGNLVSNAFSYGDRGKPVTVTSSIEADGFSVAVHNEGTPIAPETAASLFQPMTRGVQANSSKRSVGLGLFIVAEIARAHGGSTSVESSADAGTTFISRFRRQG